MNINSWLCSICNQTEASSFCFCCGKETLLCETCFISHHSKNPYLVHITLPISAYGQHTIPGYFERLQSRSASFPKAKTALLSNISEIDRCIAEVRSQVQAVLSAVSERGVQLEAELQTVKENLERDVLEALSQVERTMHEDDPALGSSWAVALREGRAEDLEVFSFRMEVTALLEQLTPFVVYTAKKPRGKDAKMIIAGVDKDVLCMYNVETCTCSKASLSAKLAEGLRLCLISENSLLCVGGKPAIADANLVALSSGEVTPVSPMLQARAFPGVIKQDLFVYVFGGQQEASCEKFHTLRKGWTRLPSMSCARYLFAPCAYKTSIYLVDSIQRLEVLNLLTEQFTVLPSKPFNFAGASLSVCVGDDLVILTDAAIIKWKPGEAQISTAPYTVIQGTPSSQLSPLLIGSNLYFVKCKESMSFFSFSIDTYSITKLAVIPVSESASQ